MMKKNLKVFTDRLLQFGDNELLNVRLYSLTVGEVLLSYRDAGLELPIRILENTWLRRYPNTDRHGWGNGYVRIVKGNPYYGLHYDDIPVSVHGGLTFAQHITDDPFFPPGYWVGFDTAHSGDSLNNWSKSRVYQETLHLFGEIYGLPV